MSTFYIKTGDTSPAIERTLTANGLPILLTGATVRFMMRRKGGTPLVSGAAVVVDVAGRVRYDWRPGDTATAGLHEAEWEITYADGTVETVPNRGYDQISIGAALGANTR